MCGVGVVLKMSFLFCRYGYLMELYNNDRNNNMRKHHITFIKEIQ